MLSPFCVIVNISLSSCLAGRLTLVEIGLGIMRLLVLLVDDGILGSGSTGAQLGIIVLGDLLVGLLGGLGTGALDGLGNVLCGVL